MFFCLEMHANEAKGSIQSRIDPFASFTCKTADNCDNNYWYHSSPAVENQPRMVGRPRFEIPREQLQYLVDYEITIPDM